MGMQNFSSEFESPEQYIIDITYKIWEERGIGRLNDWYAADCHVYSPHGIETARANVYDHTLGTMHLFPGRDILAADIIIGDKADGFLSSHRAMSVGRHLGDGIYGAATGRSIVLTAIADCLCQNNMVVAEWLLRDHSDLLQQIGLDPIAFGRDLGRKNPEPYTVGNEAMRQRWADPDGLQIIGDEAIANRIIDTYAAIWNDKLLNTLEANYDRAIRFEGVGGYRGYGCTQVADLLTSILASIPDGRFEPYHVIVKREVDRPIRVALRWSYCGTLIGHGRYGNPSSCPLAILGISHFELRDLKILNEWMIVDETAIYAQIAAYQS